MSAALAPIADRRDQLGALIECARPLWRPQPFIVGTPPWADEMPQLAAELLALDDAAVASLAGDDAALRAALRRHLPQLEAIAELTALAPAPTWPGTDPGPHFDWAIPGRKRTQIEAFCAAVGEPVADVIDWCAGKGHLGRLFAARWGCNVVSLERDAALVAASLELAQRARLPQQQAVGVNVLAASESLHQLLGGRHVVALHACGELHRALVGAAIAAGAAALDFSPCCYGRFLDAAAGDVLNGSTDAQPPLSFDRADLKLAVTGAVTAAPRETLLRRREGCWKLGLMQLLAGAGEWAYRPLCAIPAAFLHEDFSGFCRQLAARDAIVLPASADFTAAEVAGAARWRRVERFELVRLAYRRALEVWLVLDLAAQLEAGGYAVSVTAFCPPALTPRNLLVSARR